MKPHLLPFLVVSIVCLTACSKSDDENPLNSKVSTVIQPLDSGSLAKEDYEVPDEDTAYRNGRILFWQARRLHNAALRAFYDTSHWPTASFSSTRELCSFLIEKGYLEQKDVSNELLQYISIAKITDSDSDDTVFAVSINFPGTGNSSISPATGGHVFALSKGGNGGIFHDWSLPSSIENFVLPPNSRGFLENDIAEQGAAANP